MTLSERPLPFAFCPAKWLQVTIDLANGTTHSCHHPERHLIPETELRHNPSALHNTSFKKSVRRQMLAGVRPSECSYCWDLEDRTQSAVSDRFIKASDPWAAPYIDEILGLPWDADVTPTYLEVMLDDLCNCSCIYCLGAISTGVASEMKHHGPYRVRAWRNRMPNAKKPVQNEQFYGAFYRWLPEILSRLHVLRITGGEPLLSPQWATLAAVLRKQKSPKLKLAVNSHLSHLPERYETFLTEFKALQSEGHAGSLEIYTSLDSWGEQAEYIRSGLSLDLWRRNLAMTTERLPGVPVVVMCTFNLLSFSNIQELLKEILKLKIIHPELCIDASLLRYPEYLIPNIATPDLKAQLRNAIGFMKDSSKFTVHEIQKFQNISQAIEVALEPSELARLRGDFYRFIHEFDRRKGSEFSVNFTTYKEFLIECKKAVLANLGANKSEF